MPDTEVYTPTEEELATADENLAGVLDNEPQGEAAEDHEAAAELEARSSDDDGKWYNAYRGLRSEVASLRAERADLKGRLDSATQEGAAVKERLESIGEWVEGQKGVEAARQEAAGMPDPQEKPEEHARWVLKQATGEAVKPLAEELRSAKEEIGAIKTHFDKRGKDEEDRKAQDDQRNHLLQSLNYEAHQMTPGQAAARDTFMARRKQEYLDSGFDEATAGQRTFGDIVGEYDKAFRQYGEIGHAGEYLERAIQHWGWKMPEGADPAAAAPAQVPAEIRRRNAIQRSEQPPPSSTRSVNGSGAWSELKKTFQSHLDFKGDLSEVAARRRAMDEKLAKAAKAMNRSVEELKQELLGV